MPSVAMVRRFDVRRWAGLFVPGLVAVAGWATLASSGGDAALMRGVVFVGGPLLLLSGLHARLDGYLHARARQRLLPLPLPPQRHWAAARRPHLEGLVWTGAVGIAAVAGGALATGLPRPIAAGLVADFVWVWLMALLVEPVVPAAAAWLGRRFDEDRPERRWQVKLGGGWTLPEAVVHLYAPALGVSLSALLAMPGQLWLDRRVDGLASPPALLVVAGAAMVVAAVAGRLALGAYRAGMFGAVPWVHEAVRTLAGPPVPEEVPRWLRHGRDPMRRLVVQQFWRTTPVPGVRLWALLLGAGWVALAADPSVPAAAVVLALAAGWLLPGASVAALRPERARLAAALPLPPSARRGRSWSAWALLSVPVVASAAAVALAWSRSVP